MSKSAKDFENSLNRLMHGPPPFDPSPDGGGSGGGGSGQSAEDRAKAIQAIAEAQGAVPESPDKGDKIPPPALLTGDGAHLDEIEKRLIRERDERRKYG